MKLLFDQNLSPHLVSKLPDRFSGSVHVRDVGLSRSPDEAIWQYAKKNGLAVVSKDTDFMQMSFLYGAPPKVICIRRGNCSTDEVERLLVESGEIVAEFMETDELTYLLLH